MTLRSIVKRLIGPALTRRIRQARMPRFDGGAARQWWRVRDQTDPGLLDFYWQSRTAPARRAIADAVSGLDGNSLIEVGCHTGPNLWAVAQAKPFARLAGTDMSPTVIAEARRRLDAANVAAELNVAAAGALPFADKSFDICLTSVTLVCIGSDAIDASLNEILRVTRQWLVLCEPWSDGAADRPDYHPETTYWIRNYRDRLKGRAEFVSVRHLPPEHRIGHLDSISIFRLPQNGAPI